PAKPAPPSSKPVPASSKPMSSSGKQTPAPPGVVDAVVAGPPVKEVVWKPGAELPPAPAVPQRHAGRDDDAAPVEYQEPIFRRRKKKSHRGPVILIGLCIATLLIGAS